MSSSSPAQPDVATRFKANVVGLAGNFKAINNSAIQKGYNFVRREIAVFVELYLSRLDPKDLLRTFVEHSYTYWSEIANRDNAFFDQHAESVFNLDAVVDADLKAVIGDTRNVVLFRQLLTCQEVVTEQDKLLFWNYFETMVRICWKAILEDEARKEGDVNFWISREMRDKVLSIDNIESIIAKIEARKTKK